MERSSSSAGAAARAGVALNQDAGAVRCGAWFGGCRQEIRSDKTAWRAPLNAEFGSPSVGKLRQRVLPSSVGIKGPRPVLQVLDLHRLNHAGRGETEDFRVEEKFGIQRPLDVFRAAESVTFAFE